MRGEKVEAFMTPAQLSCFSISDITSDVDATTLAAIRHACLRSALAFDVLPLKKAMREDIAT